MAGILPGRILTQGSAAGAPLSPRAVLQLMEVLGEDWTFWLFLDAFVAFWLSFLQRWECCHGPGALPWHSTVWHSGQAGLPPLCHLPEEKALPLQIHVSPGLCWEGATLHLGVTVPFLGVSGRKNLVACAGKRFCGNWGLGSWLADCLGESLFMNQENSFFTSQRWGINLSCSDAETPLLCKYRIQAELRERVQIIVLDLK